MHQVILSKRCQVPLHNPLFELQPHTPLLVSSKIAVELTWLDKALLLNPLAMSCESEVDKLSSFQHIIFQGSLVEQLHGFLQLESQGLLAEKKVWSDYGYLDHLHYLLGTNCFNLLPAPLSSMKGTKGVFSAQLKEESDVTRLRKRLHKSLSMKSAVDIKEGFRVGIALRADNPLHSLDKAQAQHLFSLLGGFERALFLEDGSLHLFKPDASHRVLSKNLSLEDQLHWLASLDLLVSAPSPLLELATLMNVPFIALSSNLAVRERLKLFKGCFFPLSATEACLSCGHIEATHCCRGRCRNLQLIDSNALVDQIFAISQFSFL